jgi:hypothetical protein
MKKPSVSQKSLIFGAAGALGTFIGDGIGEITGLAGYTAATYWANVGLVAAWTLFIALGAMFALLSAQVFYLKRRFDPKMLVKTALFGLLSGVIAGALSQIIFGITANISVSVEVITRIICWGIMGLGIGLGVSFFMPNFPRIRALVAGLAGGLIGGAFFRATFSLPGTLGRLVGVAILGFFIGITISLVEEALREASLTVVWGPKEMRSIGLGRTPVKFGRAREADVYIPDPDKTHGPIRAQFRLENNRIIIEDPTTGRRSVLKNGSRINMGKVYILVSTKGDAEALGGFKA